MLEIGVNSPSVSALPCIALVLSDVQASQLAMDLTLQIAMCL